MDPSGDLLVLHTGVVADCTKAKSDHTMQKIGQQRRVSFFQDRPIVRTKHMNDTIINAEQPLCHNHVHKEKSRKEHQLKALRGALPVIFDTLTWLTFSHMIINRICLRYLTMEL